VDTQISRLGGPNFHEIPINAPIAPVHNNQRDGMHRQSIHRGRVSYEPNSLGGGCPFQAGAAGFVSFPQPVQEDKVRGNPEKFADHYTQATLFYNSQSPVEKANIAAAFRFELSKLTVPAIRQRMLSSLVNVSRELAGQVAEGLGMEVPPAMPRALTNPAKPEVKTSRRLSLMARPGDGGIRTRRVAVLVAEGVDGNVVAAIVKRLKKEGAVPKIVSTRIGPVRTSDGGSVEADASMENEPSFLFDALILTDGEPAITALSADGHTMEYIKDQYRHLKTILALGRASSLLQKAAIPSKLPDGETDPGVLLADSGKLADALDSFVEAAAHHRHFQRHSDPPRV
jgi:catalase